MTKEEKAKAYDEKLDVAMHIYADPSVKEEDKYYIEVIFPELAESEDERIRKALICGMHALKDQHKTCFASIPIDNVIAWLEAQSGKVVTKKLINDFINYMSNENI